MKLWFERGAWASRNGMRKASAIVSNKVQRVVIIRHAALGDMVLLRPFLVEARKFFPEAHITLSLVSNYTYGAPVELVDEIHIMPGSDRRGDGIFSQIKQARALGKIDILFDLADTVRSRYLTLVSQAKLKIGFPYSPLVRNALFDAAVPRSDYFFEAENMLHLLTLLGAKPSYPLDYGWRDVPAGRNIPKRLVYFPFASIQSKCWPIEFFIDLITELAVEMPDYTHTVLRGIGENETIDNFQSKLAKFTNVKFEPALEIDELRKLLMDACIVVSNDTGVRNMAIAAGTSTLGIFFSTVPYRYWPRTGQHRVVFNQDGAIPDVSDVKQAIVATLRQPAIVV